MILQNYSEIISFGFEINILNEFVYLKFCGSEFVFLVLYMDIILLANIGINMLQVTKNFLIENSGMKDFSDASFSLGIETLRDEIQKYSKFIPKELYR